MSKIRPLACEACPYRKDVPSGVWAVEDYAKLPPYDAETFAQPTAAFACHATPHLHCHGWAVCHGEGLLSLRLRGVHNIPPPSTPLFASGYDAATHGIKDIRNPKPVAKRMMAKLLGKYKRLRG